MSGWTLGSGLAVAIELSTASGGVAVRCGDRTVERELSSSRAHAVDLLPRIAEAAAELGATPRDIRAVIVGLGPGSYTGLRVAAATALGLARGVGAALRGVASIEALARTELAPGECGAVLMDARAGELYVARYRRSEASFEQLDAPTVARAAELGPRLAGVDVLFADDAALRAAGLDGSSFPSLRPNAPRAAHDLELGLTELAREGSHAPASIEPLYLRAFAATLRRR